MKEHIKEHIIYIAEDGLEFDNAIDCIEHEQANAFSKDMENILKVQNIPFVNGMLVNGYWCESQYDLDCCISWWIEAQKSIGRICTTKSIFLDPDYYFILLDTTSSNFENNQYEYNFLPYSYLQKQWDIFSKLIPSDPYAYDVMQKIREKHHSFKEKNNDINLNKNIQEKQTYNKEEKETLLNRLNKKTQKKKR